jgi:hypothetical protein
MKGKVLALKGKLGISKLSMNWKFATSVQAKIGGFFLAAVLATSLVHVANGLLVTTKEIRSASRLQVEARVNKNLTGLENFLRSIRSDLVYLRDIPPTMFALKAKLDNKPVSGAEDPSTQSALTVLGMMKSRKFFDGFLLVDGSGTPLVDVRGTEGDFELAGEDDDPAPA